MVLAASVCDALRAEARRVLAQNRRRGISTWEGRAFDFVCPSLGHYPFQWFWDSCFHAIVLAHFDMGLACRELQSLLDAADPAGFMPHIIFWEKERFASAIARYNIVLRGSHTTATIQPPVLALALEHLAARGAPAAWLRTALGPALRYYRWLAASRDPDDDGLIAILQPDESGMDAAPQFDAALSLAEPTEPALNAAMARLFEVYAPHRSDDRYCLTLDVFNVEDVLVNVVWIEALRALARLQRRYAPPEMGPEASEAEALALDARAAHARSTLLARSYDAASGAFFDLVGRQETPARVLAVSSLMPLYLADLPGDVAARLVAEHLTAPARFWLPFPVPSVAADEPTFEPDFRSGLIWRGPTWLNTNWFLVHGLRRHGFAALADEIVERSARLVLRAGFRECYNPYTGEGYGAHDFAWSTLIVDLLPSHHA